MSMEKSVRPARMIVVGNEKGGSGKSTVAMHVAVALMKAHQTVATIDLDSRQRSLTHYVDNRRGWGQRIGRELDLPQHLCLDASAGGESERCTAFADAVDARAADARLKLAERLARGAKEKPSPRLVVVRVRSPAFVDVVIVPGHDARTGREHRRHVGRGPKALDVEPSILLRYRAEQRIRVFRAARALRVTLDHFIGIDLVAGVDDDIDVARVVTLDDYHSHARHRGRRGVGAVRRRWNQTDIAMGIAA